MWLACDMELVHWIEVYAIYAKHANWIVKTWLEDLLTISVFIAPGVATKTCTWGCFPTASILSDLSKPEAWAAHMDQGRFWMTIFSRFQAKFSQFVRFWHTKHSKPRPSWNHRPPLMLIKLCQNLPPKIFCPTGDRLVEAAVKAILACDWELVGRTWHKKRGLREPQTIRRIWNESSEHAWRYVS